MVFVNGDIVEVRNVNKKDESLDILYRAYLLRRLGDEIDDLIDVPVLPYREFQRQLKNDEKYVILMKKLRKE